MPYMEHVVEELDGRIGDLLKVLEDEKLKENHHRCVSFRYNGIGTKGQKSWGSAYPFPGE